MGVPLYQVIFEKTPKSIQSLVDIDANGNKYFLLMYIKLKIKR